MQDRLQNIRGIVCGKSRPRCPNRHFTPEYGKKPQSAAFFRYNSITNHWNGLQNPAASGKIGAKKNRLTHTGKDTAMKKTLLALALAGLLSLGLTAPSSAAVEELVNLRIDEVAAYSPEEEVYTVLEDGSYGYYHADGTLLLEPNYAFAGEFHDGLALVSLSGEWTQGRDSRFQGGRFGYVDTEGTLVIPMQYVRAFPFSEGRAFAVDASGTLVLLDKTGEEVAAFPDAALEETDCVRFSDGVAVIPVHGGEEQPATVYLVIDSAGRELCILTDAWVDYQNGFHDGRIAVAEKGEWELDEDGSPLGFLPTPGTWGYRDHQGELAIPYQYEAAEAFSGGKAAVCVKGENGKTGWGLIAASGEETVPAEYDGAVTYPDGFAALLQQERWAYADPEGRQITGFDFEQVEPFQDGAALCYADGALQAIDETGAVLFTSDAAGGLGFSGGVTVLIQADGSCGVSDMDGNLLVPFTYENAYHWGGCLWLKRGDIWRVYDTEEVIDAKQAAPFGASAEVGGFTDVPAGSWYAEAVTWATDHDVITGTGGGQFSPDKSCTTGEILTFLWRAVGRPEPIVENPFTDVSPSNYYYQAALWAYENGMVDGETFGAAELCSRAMAVAYLWYAADCPMGDIAAFADVDAEAEYAQAVAWAVAEGITAGSGDGLFSPDAVCSRGQIVTFLFRFLVEET